MLDINGKIPMRWWDNELNFGDLLGPWLVSKMTGKEVVWVEKDEPHYLVVGSIIGRVTPASCVWGVGSFGTEAKQKLTKSVEYLAVRGPLTRSKLEMFGIKAPRIYGDPALLAPKFYKPQIEKKYELGLILRWSEHSRKEEFNVPGVKVIELLTDDIEGVLDEIMECKRIISTSLHGLILADAYDIPNAWLIADTGAGKEYKFWDYLISVNKVRKPAVYDIKQKGLTLEKLLADFHFDGRPIDIDLQALLDASPFSNKSEVISSAEHAAIAGSKFMKEEARLAAIKRKRDARLSAKILRRLKLLVKF